jgi:predicted XRE-type DNA-binding protein
MNQRPTLAKFREEALQNPVVQAEYLALEEEYALLDTLIKARKLAQLSQAEVAVKLKTKQPAIARLEKGPLSKLSLQTLIEYVHALGFQLQFNLVPIKK